MNILEALKAERSKDQMDRIAIYIGNDPERFAELMEQLLRGDAKIQEWAAWAFSHCIDRYPELGLPYLEELMVLLRQDNHPAVPRAVLRYFQNLSFPEEMLGPLYEICFDWMCNPQKPSAIRVFSMSTLLRIVYQVPELKGELKLAIETHLPWGSAGFKNRGGKVLKALNKIKA